MESFVKTFTTLSPPNPPCETHHEYSTADRAQTYPTAYDNY
jgi:hypothetical protein